jgi:hypothetical protein
MSQRNSGSRLNGAEHLTTEHNDGSDDHNGAASTIAVVGRLHDALAGISQQLKEITEKLVAHPATRAHPSHAAAETQSPVGCCPSPHDR